MVKPLLDAGDLCRLALYRRDIIVERLKSLPLLLHVSPESLLSGFKRLLSLLEPLDIVP